MQDRLLRRYLVWNAVHGLGSDHASEIGGLNCLGPRFPFPLDCRPLLLERGQVRLPDHRLIRIHNARVPDAVREMDVGERSEDASMRNAYIAVQVFRI